MYHYTIAPGTTDVTLYLFVPDSSSSVGGGLTGLVYNSASLVCYYTRSLAAAAQLNLATQTVTGAHSDGGFVEVSAANAPGLYRLDLSDAVCAVNAGQVWLELKGAGNMVPVLIHITLGLDVNAATFSSGLDLTATMKASINAEMADVLTVDLLADSVATDGTRPTMAQAIYEIVQFLTEKSITSTTLTVKKVDGSTSLMTFTLDSATTPTSITRAS
jgi:hypothetical protein